MPAGLLTASAELPDAGGVYMVAVTVPLPNAASSAACTAPAN